MKLTDIFEKKPKRQLSSTDLQNSINVGNSSNSDCDGDSSKENVQPFKKQKIDDSFTTTIKVTKVILITVHLFFQICSCIMLSLA